ncbi:MAG: 5'-3' exonuclease H3TH domain-containing protein [Methylobacter sp.]
MNYLLIDGNSVGRAAHSASKLTVGGDEVQAVYGFIRTLQGLLRAYPNSIPICLWDGRAQWRFDLFPLYKSNRSDNAEKIKDNEAYKAQVPKIKRLLNSLGVMQMIDPAAEADDLAGYFSRKLAAVKQNSVTLVTGDQDWCQLVSHNVDWLDHRVSKYCNVKNFKEFTGFDSTSQFVEAKCLTGDASDNIPGIGGMGEKGVVEFLRQYGSVEKFLIAYDYKAIAPGSLSKTIQRFADNEAPADSSKYGRMEKARDAYYRNLKLMQLRFYAPSKATLKVDKGEFDLSLFRELCENLMFKSIIRQLDIWTLPFAKSGRKETA